METLFQHFMVKKFIEFANSQEGPTKEVLLKLVSLYASWNLEKNFVFMYEGITPISINYFL